MMTVDDAQSEAMSVWSWRFEQLRKLGFTCDVAEVLARDDSVDWHMLEAILAAGCSRTLALKIVA